MKNQYLLTLLIILLSYSFVSAQDEEEESSPVTISGSVDAYFRTNLGSPNRLLVDGDGDSFISAPGTSFAQLPGFSLGMANLIIAKDGEKTGFVADLVFGPRGAEAVFNSAAPLNIVNQLYAYWKVSDDVTLSIGNFNTFLGYEVISPTANFNYSTSYMFSYGPFSHSGLKADFALSDDVSAMIGVFNPTDFTDFNPVSTYTIGAQFGFNGIYLNFLYGDQDGKLDETYDASGDFSAGSTFQVDLTAGWDLSETLYLGVNATYNTTGEGEVFDGTSISDAGNDANGFLGAALYLQLATSDAFSIGTRLEYFSEFEGGAGAIGTYDTEGDASIIDITLTGQYKVGDLTIIPEFRLDSGSEDGTFIDSDLAASKSLSSFVLAAVYSF